MLISSSLYDGSFSSVGILSSTLSDDESISFGSSFPSYIYSDISAILVWFCFNYLEVIETTLEFAELALETE